MGKGPREFEDDMESIYIRYERGVYGRAKFGNLKKGGEVLGRGKYGIILHAN